MIQPFLCQLRYVEEASAEVNMNKSAQWSDTSSQDILSAAESQTCVTGGRSVPAAEQRVLGQKPPVKHNNSQDICTRLQIKIKPPSEFTVPALTLDPKLPTLFLPISDEENQWIIVSRVHEMISFTLSQHTTAEYSGTSAAVLLRPTRGCSTLSRTGTKGT